MWYVCQFSRIDGSGESQILSARRRIILAIEGAVILNYFSAPLFL